jgi:hypothetical protein
MRPASVYTNSDVCRSILDSNDLVATNDISSTHLAIFHIPFPYTIEFEQAIDIALIHCDCIVILATELHRTTVDFINRYQHSNIKYFTCGFINNVNSIQWMDWFINTKHFYQKHNLLNQLTPFNTKEKTFDILLGATRPHRDFIYNKIINSSLINNSILTYYKVTNLELFTNENFILEPGTTSIASITHTVGKVEYYGEELHISTIVPISIYNQTAYSIVAETNFDNDYSFYTEKIVKPIMAERLFIVFSGQYYLRNLRRFGFKTFDNIINETYDTIEDSTTRFEQAIKQMEYLITLPQEEVLQQIREIVQHNKRIMFETNWQEQFYANLKTILTN